MADEPRKPGEIPELEVGNPKTGMPKDMGERPQDSPSRTQQDTDTANQQPRSDPANKQGV